MSFPVEAYLIRAQDLATLWGQAAARLSAIFFVPPDNHLRKAPREGQKLVEEFWQRSFKGPGRRRRLCPSGATLRRRTSVFLIVALVTGRFCFVSFFGVSS
jgi:hypothetical protein